MPGILLWCACVPGNSATHAVAPAAVLGLQFTACWRQMPGLCPLSLSRPYHTHPTHLWRDEVLQAAHSANDGYRAVPRRRLGHQATRLKAGGHQNKVGGSHDPVRQLLCKSVSQGM
jgi:hypothetical protein